MKKRVFKEKRIVLSVLLMTTLIAAACFLPQFVFFLQDSLFIGNVRMQSREGLNLEGLNIPYETSLKKRMENFAGTGDYFVTGSEVKTDVDSYAMVEERVFSGDMIFNLVSMGIFPEIIYKGFSINELKKYVIYNEKLNEGVAIMAWYAEISLVDTAQIELLWDERTDTVYYLKFQDGVGAEGSGGVESTESRAEFDSAKDKNLEKGYSAYSEMLRYHAENYGYGFSDAAYMIYNLASSLPYFCVDYYETDFWEKWAEIIEQGNYTVQENGQAEGIGKRGLLLVGEDKNQLISYDYLDMRLDAYDFEVLLPYGDLSLNFVFEVTDKKGFFPNVSLGISQIAKLIPEFADDVTN